MLCLVVLELTGENRVNAGRHNNVCELTGPADTTLLFCLGLLVFLIATQAVLGGRQGFGQLEVTLLQCV